MVTISHSEFWGRIDRLKVDLLATLGPPVIRTELVVGFGDARDEGPGVWLGTRTDEERDALAADDGLASATRAIVHRNGLHFRGVTVESQETVDRDYGGSWFARLR